VSSGRRASAGRRRGASATSKAASTKVRRAAREGRKDYMGPVFIGIIVVALAGTGGYFAFYDSGDIHGPYGVGLGLVSEGKDEEAIAQFDLVAPGDALYEKAQAAKVEAQGRLGANQARRDARRADALYSIITFTEEKWVDRGGQGARDPAYASHTRYMLKRAAEFLEQFPDDPRRKEIEILVYRYEDVADPKAPPSSQDVDVELMYRLIPGNPNYADALAIVDEFARAWPDRSEEAAAFRARIQAHSEEYWAETLKGIQEDGSLDPGAENWRRVAQQTLRYLNSIEGLPLQPVMEARRLHDKALSGGG
jgi:hypothetical protein